MERTKYIELAQRAGAKIAEYNYRWQDVKWEPCELVRYDERMYIPFGYTMYFGKGGKPVHMVHIRDLSAANWIDAALDKVESGTDEWKYMMEGRYHG